MQVKTLVATAAAVLIAGSAQAAVISGWSFDNYGGPSFLGYDAAVPQFSLDAQWSDLDTAADPTQYLGQASGAFGVMYHDGSNGSTDTSGGAGLDWAPSAQNLTAGNSVGQLGLELSTAGASNALFAEGEGLAPSLLGMSATANVDVVFSATPGPGAENWVLNFAGTSASGATVDVAFGTDGTGYTFVESFALTPVPTGFTSILPADIATEGFVRLSIGAGAVVDNVLISGDVVPEPGTATLMTVGLFGLARASCRRA